MNATLTPIAEVVMPLMNRAKDRAALSAREYITRILAKLAEANWDVNLAFPYPSSKSRNFHTERAEYNHARQFTQDAPGFQPTYRPRDPSYRVPEEKGQEKFVDECVKLAEAQYLAFVAKLEAKIGTVTSATLEGCHVWDYSILAVVKPDGSTERWKTQGILNFSKHGKMFNQWPTRKVKR